MAKLILAAIIMVSAIFIVSCTTDQTLITENATISYMTSGAFNAQNYTTSVLNVSRDLTTYTMYDVNGRIVDNLSMITDDNKFSRLIDNLNDPEIVNLQSNYGGRNVDEGIANITLRHQTLVKNVIVGSEGENPPAELRRVMDQLDEMREDLIDADSDNGLGILPTNGTSTNSTNNSNNGNGSNNTNNTNNASNTSSNGTRSSIIGSVDDTNTSDDVNVDEDDNGTNTTNVDEDSDMNTIYTDTGTGTNMGNETRELSLTSLNVTRINNMTILADNNFMTLYVYNEDSVNESTCDVRCATYWPPAIVDNETAMTLNNSGLIWNNNELVVNTQSSFNTLDTTTSDETTNATESTSDNTTDTTITRDNIIDYDYTGTSDDTQEEDNISTDDNDNIEDTNTVLEIDSENNTTNNTNVTGINDTNRDLNITIGVIERSDGTYQATYNGLPLYYYIIDQNPGDMMGHNVVDFGGEWTAIDVLNQTTVYGQN